jgi:hypothetical protein
MADFVQEAYHVANSRFRFPESEKEKNELGERVVGSDRPWRSK